MRLRQKLREAVQKYAQDQMVKLKDRLKLCAEHVGGVQKLADLTEIKARSLYNYVSGVSEPTANQISRIIAATGVDLRWLVLGEGQMIQDTTSDIIEAAQQRDRQAEEVFSVPDLEVVERRAGEEYLYDVSDGRIDPDVFVDIEQGISIVYSKLRAAISHADLVRLSVAWYNEFIGSGVDLSDGRAIAVWIWEKRQLLEKELQGRSNGETSGKRSA